MDNLPGGIAALGVIGPAIGVGLAAAAAAGAAAWPAFFARDCSSSFFSNSAMLLAKDSGSGIPFSRCLSDFAQRTSKSAPRCTSGGGGSP